MKVNIMYTGFMENTYAGEKDNDDFYAITLKKGQSYKFICDADSHKGKTTIVKLLGKTTKQIFSGHLWGQRISVCHPVMCLLRLIQELIMHM